RPAVGEHFLPGALLQLNPSATPPILERLELRTADLSFLISFAGLLQIGRAQETSDNIASIHGTLLFNAFLGAHPDCGERSRRSGLRLRHREKVPGRRKPFLAIATALAGRLRTRCHW